MRNITFKGIGINYFILRKIISLLILLIIIVYTTNAQTDVAPDIKSLHEKLSNLSQSKSNLILKKEKYSKKISLCQPDYEFGCSQNDGFSDFAVEQIQNFDSGCDDNTGYPGWSEYYDLDTALFLPGNNYLFTFASNYINQHVNIWIDFNDDLVLMPDEMILSDYIITEAGVLQNVEIDIPGGAVDGLHLMRAMAVWPNAFNDPCGSYLYGEAEDYAVIIEGGLYGNLEGYVTELSGGAAVEGAFISVGGFADGISGNDGYYFIEHILTGIWEVNCTKDGFNQTASAITIEEDITANHNFQLTQPQIEIDPMTVSVTLDPNQLMDEEINISNPGNGELSWSTDINFLAEEETDELFDLYFEWPQGIGTGEAGIECDGNWIYTSKWDGTAFYRYDLNGNQVGEFTCGNATGIRDLAYDGTYFYGAAANATVFQMDFDNEVVVSQFTAPTSIRAIAYDEEENVFYGNNFNTDITRFDISGTDLGSFPVGPAGSSYYGLACDNYSDGAPYLWGYAQTGATLNELVQIQLPSGIETGLTLDVGSVVAVGTGIAGGLAISNQIMNGHYIFLGVSQMAAIWGLELCEWGNPWLTLEPEEGFLPAGQNQDITLHFDAGGLIPGIYHAEIQFSSDPDVGSPITEITLQVAGLVPPVNLATQVVCTNILLSWQMPSGSLPDSWNIYRNGILLQNSMNMAFEDEMLIPDSEYNYYIKAVYSGEESLPSNVKTVVLPTPPNLEPLNPTASYQGNNSVIIAWETPDGCLVAESYHVYREESMIGETTFLEYTDLDAPYGYHHYSIRALYYFGESGNSLPAHVFVGTEELYAGSGYRIFPNPSSNLIVVESPVEIIHLKIFDIAGHLIMEFQLNALHQIIDVEKLAKGIYFIKFETREGEYEKKLMIN